MGIVLQFHLVDISHAFLAKPADLVTNFVIMHSLLKFNLLSTLFVFFIPKVVLNTVIFEKFRRIQIAVSNLAIFLKNLMESHCVKFLSVQLLSYLSQLLRFFVAGQVSRF